MLGKGKHYGSLGKVMFLFTCTRAAPIRRRTFLHDQIVEH
jgi:hypothetical protein